MKFKVYRQDGEQVAACRYVEDAAMLLGAMQDGATIRTSASRIVYIQGVSGNAALSYDAVAEHVRAEMHKHGQVMP